MQNNDTVLKQLQALAQANDDIEVLWLYGSRARGTQQADSDWDLAVAFKHFETDALARRLKPELLAMDWREKLGIALSIADIAQIPAPLASAVIQDDTVLYCNNDLRLHKEEQRIWSMWEEYCYEHERYWA